MYGGKPCGSNVKRVNLNFRKVKRRKVRVKIGERGDCYWVIGYWLLSYWVNS